MNRKALYAIIIVLALVLIAGIVFIAVMSNSGTPVQSIPDTPQSNAADQPADSPNAVVTPDQPDAPQTGDEPVTGGDTVVKPNDETQPTEAAPTEQPTEKPTEEPTGPLIPDAPEVESVPEKDTLTYQEYHALSGEEQAAFINTFASYEAFFEWYNAAEKEYNDSRIPIEEDGKIDLGGN